MLTRYGLAGLLVKIIEIKRLPNEDPVHTSFHERCAVYKFYVHSTISMKGGLMDLVAFGPSSQLDRSFNKKTSLLEKGQTRDFEWTKSKLTVKLQGEDPEGFQNQEVLEWGCSSWCGIPECSEAVLRSNERVISFSAQTGDRMLKCELRDVSSFYGDVKDIYITDDMQGFPYRYEVRAYFAYGSGTIDWDDIIAKTGESAADLKSRCERSNRWDGEVAPEDDWYFEVSEPYRCYEIENVKCVLTIETF